ncbi:cell wall hydrolase [Heliobacterium chlorum]|uniref:Cell wall hydrolase n=1 Tax=Heliobacterium chlorum TaxID=2698 RepID=A0ABR7T5P8_HELCL|nr:cell wall hydrolase [Heliobacterium chlorum]MBC9785562.1 cell wall hydrolase [Heliobacterium chlorum]
MIRSFSLRHGLLAFALTLLFSGAFGVAPAHAWQYTVQPGDNLYSLGQRFGLPWQLIQGANNVDPNNLNSGKVLAIPDVFTYTVRQGDSLFTIANRFGSAEWAIQQLNGLSSSSINAGQIVKVPTGISRQANKGVNPADADLLARLIEAEASGEPYKGKVAVGAVVLNRMKSGLFPRTIAGVIYDKWQFEPVQNGTINEPASSDSVKAAWDALSGWDPSSGSLYFFNPGKTSDSWMRQRSIITTIGNHVFSM